MPQDRAEGLHVSVLGENAGLSGYFCGCGPAAGAAHEKETDHPALPHRGKGGSADKQNHAETSASESE